MGNNHSEVLDVEYLYRDDGTIEAEWTVLNGVRHGNMRIYYKSGNLRSIIQYKHGIQHGTQTYYRDSIIHKITSKCIYVNGRKHGVETFYNEDGKLIEYDFYDRGNVRSGNRLLYPDVEEFSNSDKLGIWYYRFKRRIF